MKILLAIPSARYVENECWISLFEMEKTEDIELLVPASYSVDVARNLIVRYAQENKFDYIFWVDSDMILPKDALVRMMSHNKDIVAGCYTKKLLNGTTVVAKYRNAETDEYTDLEISEIRKAKGIIRVDAFGFGCVLTKVDMFEKIPYPWFIYTMEMGEDVYFCRKAQNCGYDMWLDTDVICGHKGSVNFDIRGKEE